MFVCSRNHESLNRFPESFAIVYVVKIERSEVPGSALLFFDVAEAEGKVLIENGEKRDGCSFD